MDADRLVFARRLTANRLGARLGLSCPRLGDDVSVRGGGVGDNDEVL